VTSETRSDLNALALLDEHVRRELYAWVVSQGRAVSRDEAAAGIGVSRSLAAFHLDRLAGAGLLAVEYRRLTGRSGPGAGRPAKLYRRGPRQLQVSVPPRRYETVARLLARAIEAMQEAGRLDALREAAGQEGQDAGERARKAAGLRAGSSPQRAQQALLDVLEERGYEPSVEEGQIRLRNCPFHALVADHRDVVCGMNLALTESLLEGLGVKTMAARLQPEDGYCCVRIGSAGT
jgi:predicted ArsR family transcriptional regulator